MSELPEEAVEAAAKAIHEAGGWDWTDSDGWLEICSRKEARAALAAAYPFIAAQALREAADAARKEQDRCDTSKPVKCGDRIAYIRSEPYGAQYWGEASDWLRDRADRIEGK